MTQPKTNLAYLRSEKAKAEQKLRSCQHREKILERQMSELNRRERVHRLCTRTGMLESFLICPGELTDDQVMELLKISFRQPEVVLTLAKMVHDVHERSNVQTAHSGGGFRRGQRDGADCKGHAGTACCSAAAVRNRHPDPSCAVCCGCNFREGGRCR